MPADIHFRKKKISQETYIMAKMFGVILFYCLLYIPLLQNMSLEEYVDYIPFLP